MPRLRSDFSNPPWSGTPQVGAGEELALEFLLGDEGGIARERGRKHEPIEIARMIGGDDDVLLLRPGARHLNADAHEPKGGFGRAAHQSPTPRLARRERYGDEEKDAA